MVSGILVSSLRDGILQAFADFTSQMSLSNYRHVFSDRLGLSEYIRHAIALISHFGMLHYALEPIIIGFSPSMLIIRYVYEKVSSMPYFTSPTK